MGKLIEVITVKPNIFYAEDDKGVTYVYSKRPYDPIPLSDPLPIETIIERAKKSGDNFVDGTVSIGTEVFDGDDGFEGFLDHISKALIGSYMLMQVSGTFVGTSSDGYMLVNVTGDASRIIECEERGESLPQLPTYSHHGSEMAK